MTLISYVDGFDATNFTTKGGVVGPTGIVTLPASTAVTSILSTVSTYSLSGSVFYCQVTVTPSSAPYAIWIGMSDATDITDIAVGHGNDVYWVITSVGDSVTNTATVKRTESGTNTATGASPAILPNTFWLRVRDFGGSFIFEASPDNFDWVTVATLPEASATAFLANASWFAIAGFNSASAATVSVTVSNFNVTPPVITAPTLTVPHVSMPFDLEETGRPSYCEQDSVEDVQSCVLNLLSCQVGANPYDPDFGRPEFRGDIQPVDTSDLLEQVTDYEPRLDDLDIEVAQSLIEVGVEQISVSGTVRQET